MTAIPALAFSGTQRWQSFNEKDQNERINYGFLSKEPFQRS